MDKPTYKTPTETCQICSKQIDQTGGDNRRRIGTREDGQVICASCLYTIERDFRPGY